MGKLRDLCDDIALARAWPFVLMGWLRDVVTFGAAAFLFFGKISAKFGWMLVFLQLVWLPSFIFDYCRRPRAVREARIRRGLCLSCGYPLTGNTSGICPECGTPVRA